MDRPIETAFVFVFLLTGVSHAFQPARWLAFFQDLFTWKHGAWAVVMYTLPPALVFALGVSRDDCAGWIVRGVGCGMALKSTVYLLWPRALERWARPGFLTPAKFVAAGVVSLALAGVVAAGLWWPDR